VDVAQHDVQMKIRFLCTCVSFRFPSSDQIEPASNRKGGVLMLQTEWYCRGHGIRGHVVAARHRVEGEYVLATTTTFHQGDPSRSSEDDNNYNICKYS
jgi:hypothetical protein